MIYILAATSAFFLSFALTLVVIRIGYRYKLLSKIRERDIHKKPVPRIGGVAIFLSFLIISLCYFLIVHPDYRLVFSTLRKIDPQLMAIWSGAIIITVSMLYDDIRGLNAWQKFFLQFLAVFCIISGGIGIDKLANPFGEAINLNSVYIPLFNLGGVTYHFSLWSDLLTLVWMVGMMNVINFVDGIDGLASGTSIIAALAIFFVAFATGQPAVALIAIILAGSAGGFLILNYPPAKVFMGDSGAMFLGYMLGVLPLLSGGKLATAFLVLGFPILDGLFVAGGRLLRHQNPFTSPDKTHLHHRFIAAGFSQRQALFTMWMIAVCFAWVALRSNTLQKIEAFAILVAVLLTLIWGLSRKATSQR